MENRTTDILIHLNDHLRQGTLKVEAFPQADVMEMIQTEYEQWMGEKFQQLKEYIRIYRLLMEEAVNKNDVSKLSKILSELILDSKSTPIDALNGMSRLKKEMEDILDDKFRQQAKQIYDAYPFQSSSNKVAFRGKGVIYTVITGNYDVLREPEYISPDFDYICFTDNREQYSKTWNIYYIENEEGLDLSRFSRKYKILCHTFLSDYDYSIYVDGKMQIIGDLNEYIRKYSKGSSMLCFPHFVRNCAYEEADACVRIGKDREDIIHKQMNRYRRIGYPANNGLIDAACLVRRHDDPILQKVMECWWQEVREGSRRDQLSIGYACWNNDFHYDLCDLYSEKNEYICKRRDG